MTDQVPYSIPPDNFPDFASNRQEGKEVYEFVFAVTIQARGVDSADALHAASAAIGGGPDLPRNPVVLAAKRKTNGWLCRALLVGCKYLAVKKVEEQDG